MTSSPLFFFSTAQPTDVDPSSATAAGPTQGKPGVSGAQRRAQALRLGALVSELEKTLQDQSISEKELKALNHQLLHLGTILKVPACNYACTLKTIFHEFNPNMSPRMTSLC